MKGLFIFISFVLFSCTTQAIEKPNIIIFYVDDLGWQDSQLNDLDQPSPWETPNMLKLAKQGMNFTQAYSAAPTCAPSRAGLLSGQHPAKLQLTHVLGANLPVPQKHGGVEGKMIAPYIYDHLQPNTLTIAQALQDNGYRTGHVGKWHVGNYENQGPLTVGFEYSYEGRGVHRNSNDRSKDFASHSKKDKFRLSEEKYAPFSNKHPKGISYPYDAVTENALSFIEQKSEKPFFLYLAHWMVHYPTVTKNRALLEYYSDKLGIEFPQDKSDITTPGQTNPYYGAMVTTVDWSLGKLISMLENTDDVRNPGKKLIETTYIFFSSDNGGAENRGREVITDNAPLDQGKKYSQEGGIRVPMVVTGPTITAGSKYSGLVNQLDYFPTILSLTHGNIAAQDANKLSGLDITPLLSNSSKVIKDSDGKVRENLFWHFPHYGAKQMQSALRQGDFKLYLNHHDGSFNLFRLYKDGNRDDLEEKIDLANKAKFQPTLDELSNNLATLLKENNAVFPKYNPKFSGSLLGKKQAPQIITSSFNRVSSLAKIGLSTDKTSVDIAYVLGKLQGPKRSKGKDGKNFITYQKINAHIDSTGNEVAATIPDGIGEYRFVLVDQNNFLVMSEAFFTKN